MAEKTKPQEFPTLLGTGHAAVFGLPRNFDLNAALAHAREIRLATAFARFSGWKLIREGVLKCNGTIHLLAGLELNHTDPKVLWEWLKLRDSCGARVVANRANGKLFFHPKVLIIRAKKPTESLAVVSSGNLSDGGLGKNVECGIVATDPATIDALTEWFEEHLQFGIPLTGTMISKYEPKFKAAEAKRTDLQKEAVETEQSLTELRNAEMVEWKKALNAAVKYFNSPRFKTDYARCQQAAGEIRKALHAPGFNFNHEEFKEFFRIHNLGRVVEIIRDNLYGQKKLRIALRELFKRPESAIHDVLGRHGSLRVKFLKVATVSKILAAHKLTDWPAYNHRADEALAVFGYKAPRGADAADKYLAFRNLMKKFMEECAERLGTPVDVLALDRFILDVWKKDVPKKAAGRSSGQIAYQAKHPKFRLKTQK